jgi:hypothetical protein
MKPGYLFHRFFAPMLSLGMAAALLLVVVQSASAQEVTVTAPFSFSVENHQYPAGTYRFTLASGWILSMHNADGKQNFFPIRPERGGPSGSRGGLTFHKYEGRHELLAVYIPGTDMTAVLLPASRLPGTDLLVSRMKDRLGSE